MLGRRRRFPAILLLTLAWLTAVAGPVAAQDVPRLPDEVTDEAGLLEGREDEVRSALAEVRDQVQLFVLTTGTTGGTPITDFADEVAATNSLGGDDALLVVAIDDRAYALWVANALTGVSDGDIAAINRDVIEPRLADGDFAGAAIDAAAALADAAADEPRPAPTPGPDATPAPEPTNDPSTGRVSRTPWVLAAVVLAFLGAAAYSRIRERRGRRRSAEERDRRLGELARQANARLVASDEAVREAATELGFAEAQFHADDVAPLRVALSQARAQL
ncbi:MAG TPA: TPM domain-containing protein, partial [Egicoccus sp.]